MIEHSDKNKFKTIMELFMYHVDLLSYSNSFQERTERSYDSGIFYAVRAVIYFTFTSYARTKCSDISL